LELAPSVACKLALSHNHLPLIYFYYFQNNSKWNLSQAFLKAETLFINKSYFFGLPLNFLLLVVDSPDPHNPPSLSTSYKLQSA
jgi:hypothetical protein